MTIYLIVSFNIKLIKIFYNFLKQYFEELQVFLEHYHKKYNLSVSKHC